MISVLKRSVLFLRMQGQFWNNSNFEVVSKRLTIERSSYFFAIISHFELSPSFQMILNDVRKGSNVKVMLEMTR